MIVFRLGLTRVQDNNVNVKFRLHTIYDVIVCMNWGEAKSFICTYLFFLTDRERLLRIFWKVI